MAGILLNGRHVTHSIRLVVALLLASSLTIALCRIVLDSDITTASGGSSALTASQVAGTWKLVSMQLDGQAAQAAPSGYTLTLDDGQLSTRADCNTCSGRFTLTDQTFTAGPALACTRAACATMAFETAYTGVLSGQSTATVSGNTLVLSSSRGVLQFSR